MKPRFTTKIQAYGHRGNVFWVGGTAMQLMKELGLPTDEITAFRQRLSASKSYDAACAIVEEYFSLDRGDS